MEVINKFNYKTMKKNKKVQTKETTLGCSEYPHKNYKELKNK